MLSRICWSRRDQSVPCNRTVYDRFSHHDNYYNLWLPAMAGPQGCTGVARSRRFLGQQIGLTCMITIDLNHSKPSVFSSSSWRQRRRIKLLDRFDFFWAAPKCFLREAVRQTENRRRCTGLASSLEYKYHPDASTRFKMSLVPFGISSSQNGRLTTRPCPLVRLLESNIRAWPNETHFGSGSGRAGGLTEEK